MNLHSHTRETSCTILKRVRSKSLDVERRLLLDQMTAEQLLDKADELTGLGILLEREARSAIIHNNDRRAQL
jgi:uncharacterized protein YaaR (DUF327 family)